MKNSEKRAMPICFTANEVKLIEEYAKKKGMFNSSQVIEYIIKTIRVSC